MKTLIIYTSQTGFTKRYALWLAGKVDGDVPLELPDIPCPVHKYGISRFVSW